MAQAAVSHRKLIEVDLTDVKMSNWSIIFFDTRIFSKCEHLMCKNPPEYIGGRACKRPGRQYMGMCRLHFHETGGCSCNSRHDPESLIAGKKNKAYVFELSLPSSTSETLEVLPSSSGLPPPPTEQEEKKKEVNLNQRIDKLRNSVLYLQQQINDLKKEKA